LKGVNGLLLGTSDKFVETEAVPVHVLVDKESR
jgi:hypothetical protein